MTSRRILVIGGTGAQGFEIVKALLSADEPFTVRVLSRNPDSAGVRKAFKEYPQVEFFQGSFMDFASIEKALEDCYGVYVNTDGMLQPFSSLFLACYGISDKEKVSP